MLCKLSSHLILGLSVAVIFGLLGCSEVGLDPAMVAKYGDQFTLKEEPESVQTVFEVREALLGHGEEEHATEEHANHEDADHADHEAEQGEDAHEDHAEHEHADEESADEHADETEHAHDHEAETAEEHAEHAHEHENEHAPEVTEDSEVVEATMVGQIGGLANPWEQTQPDFPFGKGEAVFFLADPQAVAEHAEEGHAHAPGEECAFCAAHAEENSELFAVVRLVDEQGKVLPVDTRKFLELKENDTVVVRGKAQVLAGGMMVVEATGIYVRK